MINKTTQHLIYALKFSGLEQLHFHDNNKCIQFNIKNIFQINIFIKTNSYSVGCIDHNNTNRIYETTITNNTWNRLSQLIDKEYQ